MAIELTPYYDEFLRYYSLAKRQQELCNLGFTPHTDSGVYDDLMQRVTLYDVVERKYAGFSQIINDAFYGRSQSHPYYEHIKKGKATREREFQISSYQNGCISLYFTGSAALASIIPDSLPGITIQYSLSLWRPGTYQEWQVSSFELHPHSIHPLVINSQPSQNPPLPTKEEVTAFSANMRLILQEDSRNIWKEATDGH
jgi:hypothetical protein